MTVGILVFLVSAIAVILLAIRLDRYEDELERRARLREQGAKGGDGKSSAGPDDSYTRGKRAGRTRTH